MSAPTTARGRGLWFGGRARKAAELRQYAAELRGNTNTAAAVEAAGLIDGVLDVLGFERPAGEVQR
jgi:hypothetical protein